VKRIKLKNYETTGKKYLVRLGNGTSHEFTTLIQVNKFLAETSAFLQRELFTINGLLIEAYAFHRMQFIVSWHGDDVKNKTLLDACEHCIHKAYQLSPTHSGNIVAFTHLIKACNFIKTIISNYSKEIDRKKNDTTGRYALKSIFDRTRQVEREIENYGQENASFFFDNSSRFSDLLTEIKYSNPITL
jgi:hypothetical protein